MDLQALHSEAASIASAHQDSAIRQRYNVIAQNARELLELDGDAAVAPVASLGIEARVSVLESLIPRVREAEAAIAGLQSWRARPWWQFWAR